MTAERMNPTVWLAKRVVEVGAHMVGERIRRPELRSRDDVPCNGTDLDTDWLTDVLCHEHVGARVTSYSTPAGSVGTSTRTALRVTYDEVGHAAGLPTALLSKTTALLSQRLALGCADALRGETQYFQTFRPRVTMEAPEGFWGGVHEPSWRSMVLMEDVQ